MANHKFNWTDKKKIEVVTTYLALGKAPMVEAVTGVPRQTIRIWKMQQWWKDLEKEILQDEEQELDAKLSKIIDKSLDAVTERIQNGEFILDSRTGTIKRVPVKLRDVHKVAIDLVDKRNLIRGKPTSITERISTEDVIRKLAAEFKNFIAGNEKVIEGEVINDALHDERETGLQEREPDVQLPAPDEETASGPEQGTSGSGEGDGTQYHVGRGPQAPVEQRGIEYPLQLESTQPPQKPLV